MFESKLISNHRNAPISHINFSMYNILVFLRTNFSYVSSIMNNFFMRVDLHFFENHVGVSGMVWEAILELP